MMKNLFIIHFVVSLFFFHGCDKKDEKADIENKTTLTDEYKCSEAEQQRVRLTKSIKEAEELMKQAEEGSNEQVSLILLIEEAKQELFIMDEEILKDCDTSNL